MKLTKDIDGVRAGNVYPETIRKGEDCPPELIDAAIALDALTPKDIAAIAKEADRRAAEEEAKAAEEAAKAEEEAKAAEEAAKAEAGDKKPSGAKG